MNNELSTYTALEKNLTLYTLSFLRDVKQRVHNVPKYTLNGKNDIPGGSYTITYNDLDQITTFVSHAINNEKIINTKTLGYDAAGNRNSIATSTPDEKSTYTFDQKNGIFKHVSHITFISLEFEHKLFNSLVNNAMTMSGSPAKNNYTCTYEYQTDDFPTKVTIMEGGVNTVYTITYKTL